MRGGNINLYDIEEVYIRRCGEKNKGLEKDVYRKTSVKK